MCVVHLQSRSILLDVNQIGRKVVNTNTQNICFIIINTRIFYAVVFTSVQACLKLFWYYFVRGNFLLLLLLIFAVSSRFYVVKLFAHLGEVSSVLTSYFIIKILQYFYILKLNHVFQHLTLKVRLIHTIS